MPTKLVNNAELDSTMVLIGRHGGRSAIYHVARSSIMPGCMAVETEHGTLYLDSDLDSEVFDD